MDVGHVLVRFHQSLCLAYLSLPTDREHLRQRRPCSGTKRVEKTHVEWDGSSLHAIGAVFPGMEICGTKTWSHTKAGATPVLLLFDTKDGSLRAVIEAFALGQMRTAAASGVATRWLALDQADEFAMIGTGKQAITQVAAVLAVRPIRRIRVFSRDEAHRNQFVARVRSEFQVETVASLTVRDAILGASIVTVATRATDPIVTADMVQTGVHINSIGAIVPTRAEISHDVLARSTKVVTDSVPQAQRLSREMIEFFGNDPAAWNAVQPLATVVNQSGCPPCSGVAASVHLGKFKLIFFHCLRRGFRSYVDASGQEGTILNGDARDYDVSTQGALAANIKVIASFAATNHLAEHYDLARCYVSRNPAVSPHRHAIVRKTNRTLNCSLDVYGF